MPRDVSALRASLLVPLRLPDLWHSSSFPKHANCLLRRHLDSWLLSRVAIRHSHSGLPSSSLLALCHPGHTDPSPFASPQLNPAPSRPLRKRYGWVMSIINSTTIISILLLVFLLIIITIVVIVVPPAQAWGGKTKTPYWYLGQQNAFATAFPPPPPVSGQHLQIVVPATAMPGP